jgi:hypothetical protein
MTDFMSHAAQSATRITGRAGSVEPGCMRKRRDQYDGLSVGPLTAPSAAAAKAKPVCEEERSPLLNAHKSHRPLDCLLRSLDPFGGITDDADRHRARQAHVLHAGAGRDDRGVLQDRQHGRHVPQPGLDRGDHIGDVLRTIKCRIDIRLNAPVTDAGDIAGLAMSALLGPTVTEVVGPTLVALTLE